MRKLLTISLLVLVMALLAVSCAPESKSLDDGLALISFSTSRGGTRSLTKTDPQLNPDDFYWYYEATKTDGTGLVTGVTDGPTPVKKATNDETDSKNGKGLDNSVGPFSYGEWSFTLYAYAGNSRPTISDKEAPATNLAYTGSASKVINKSTDTMTVVVASKQTTGVKGTLLFPLKSAMIAKTVTDAGSVTEVASEKFLEEITITRVDGSSSFDAGSTTISKQNGESAPSTKYYNFGVVSSSDSSLRTLDLESGSYKITFKYIQGVLDTNLTKNNSTITGYTAGKEEYTVAEESIYFAIADYLTTTIGGDIASNTGSVEFKVENGVTTISISKTISVDSATVFDSSSATDETAKSSGYKVSIPAGGLKGKTATLESEVYSPEVASAKNAEYLFEDSSGAVIGGESSALYEDNSTEETKTFGFENDSDEGSSSNKAKRVTKTITLAKNLNNGNYYVNTDIYPSTNGSYTGLGETISTGKTVVTGTTSTPNCDIVPKYQGDTSDYTTDKGYDIPNGVICFYNPESGLTKYQVEHFSTYFFNSKTAVYYDAKNKKAYATLKEAIADTDANKSGTLILLTDAAETVTGDKGLEIKKALTLDLNGHTLTLSDMTTTGETAASRIFTITAPFTVKNGKIKGDLKCSTFRAETNGNLTLDGVEAEVDTSEAKDTEGNKGSAVGKTLVFLYQGSNPVYATIKNSKLTFTGTYCVGSNANTSNDTSYINVTIENSILEANNDDLNCNKDKDQTTGLLANVPGNVVIKNSTISGSLQGAILRGGTYTISGSTFKSTGSKTAENYDEKDWDVGNDVPAAALVIGNRSSSYAYPTTVTFEGTNTLNVENSDRKQIYIYQANAASDSDSADRSVTITGFEDSWKVNDNFNGAIVKSGTTLLVNDEKTLKAAISCVAVGETIKFTNNITCVLYDGNTESRCDASLWIKSENVTMDFNSKKLVVKSNFGGSYNIINAFGAGCTFKNGEIYVYRKHYDSDKSCKKVADSTHGYDPAYPDWDSYALGVEFEEKGDCTIEGMKLHGGIAIYGYVEATIKNGTYADATNYYALHAEGYCKATVENCTFNGDKNGNNPIFEMLHENCSVTIKSGKYIGGKLLGGKGSLSIEGGGFTSDPISYVAEGYAATGPDNQGTYTVSSAK